MYAPANDNGVFPAVHFRCEPAPYVPKTLRANRLWSLPLETVLAKRGRR